MKKSRILALLLALAMLASMAACGAKNEAPAAPSAPAEGNNSSTPAAPAVPAGDAHYAVDAETVVVCTADETPSVTARKHNAVAGSYINNLTYETLIALDIDLVPQPCLAESYEYEEQADGSMLWTFHLRQGQYWYDCNGTQVAEVTAQDWVDALKCVADPYNDSGTYDQIKIVKGVEDYYNAIAGGGTADFNDVGVKAIDNYTLEYTLNRVTPYFIPGLVYVCWMPAYGPLIEETMK